MNLTNNKKIGTALNDAGGSLLNEDSADLARLLPLLQVFCRVNNWEEKNLPVPPTHAGKDLFIRIAMSCLSSESQSLKNLYWDSGHASSGMRKNLRQLEQDGWLRREPLPEDMRCRTLVATDGFRSLVIDYLQVLSDKVMEASAILRRARPIGPLLVSQNRWKVLIADDEPDMHDVTKLVLSNFNFEGRRIEFLHAYSGGEAMRLFDENPDIAVALIDIVMETEDAGLRVVRYIREIIENSYVRLILRTGHPGVAPEREIIRDYDINDYKTKTELSSQRLQMVILTALRAYRDIISLDSISKCTASLLGLSEELQRAVSLEQFSRMMLEKLSELLGVLSLEDECCSGVVIEGDGTAGRVVAASGRYACAMEKDLSEQIDELKSYISPNLAVKAVKNTVAIRVSSAYSKTSFNLVFHVGRPLSSRDLEYLYLFRDKVGARLDILFLELNNARVQGQAREMLTRLASRGSVGDDEVGEFEREVASWAENIFVRTFESSVAVSDEMSVREQGVQEVEPLSTSHLAERIFTTANLVADMSGGKAVLDEPWRLEEALAKLDGGIEKTNGT